MSTKQTKAVRINVKLSPNLREEFKAACDLIGTTMSNDIHQHIVAVVQSVKKTRSPSEWAEAIARVQAEADPEFFAAFGHLPIVNAETITQSDAVIVANVGQIAKG